MWRYIALALFFPVQATGAADAARDDISACTMVAEFKGEVREGKTFERDVGEGLVFSLRAESQAPPNARGWTIAIRARDGEDGEDFVWVANPPYRGFNVRDLTLSYGQSVEDVVGWNPRSFAFHTDRETNVRAVAWARGQLWGPEDDKAPEAPPQPLGRGDLSITGYSVGESASEKFLSRIAFAVRLRRCR